MHSVVTAKRHAIVELCRRFHVRRLEVFGSAARSTDFDPQRSDTDFMIEFEPGQDPGMAGFLHLKQALEQTVGRPVDLVDRQAVERSRNYLRRRQILGEAEPVYVAG
ncbi:MAG TPA: nucleotidyltransferase domain-containing protein [Acetobacteraceae bacterium]|nr:nucleotidyltransferase domain-containing protein [Acetobacteraceae bacterium]